MIASCHLGICGSTRPECSLHQYDVDPAPEFEPDRAQYPGVCEAERAVQPDRRPLLAAADDRHHLPVPQRRAVVDQAPEQGAADAAAEFAPIDIDRVLERKTIGRAGAVKVDVAIAENLPIALGDEVRQTACQN